MTRTCPLCHQVKAQTGGKLMRVLGMRRWVCAKCYQQARK